jgi:dTDP-4-dehydrorhamnose reductase
MRVAVLGARGQLGAAIVQGFASGHDVSAFDHAALDITDGAAMRASMERVRPEVIINCTGFNAVDAAEDCPIHAFQTNALGVRTVARVARMTGSVLVHYSSDFVFDGEHTTPYTEEDKPNPRSVYAASKAVGEWFAADVAASYILRVESLFGNAPDGPPAKGTVASIVEGLRNGSRPKVFVDRTVSPTYVIDAATATRQILERRAPTGLYHCVSSGWCTWADFAREAARLLGVPANFEPVKMSDVHLRATRPQYCALSNRKLHAAGIEMPTWQDALQRYTQTLQVAQLSR